MLVLSNKLDSSIAFGWSRSGGKGSLFIAKDAQTVSCMFCRSDSSMGTKSNKREYLFYFPVHMTYLQLHLHIKDNLFHCRHWRESLNMYPIRSFFISSHNTVENIKVTFVLLYSPRDVIELGGDAWDGSQGRIWLIIKQLQRNLDL